MRRLLVPLLLASLVTIALAAPTAAARPFHDKFKVDETFEENLCGVDVTTHLEINGNFLGFDDRGVDLSMVKLTWTNADGDWLMNHVAGSSTFMEELNGDILTFTEVHRGVHERLRSSDGLTEAFDRGQISFRSVIDLNDLENPDDDVEISFETLFVAGPHPEADADFTLFCDVALDVLG